jgi:hypothetical protein
LRVLDCSHEGTDLREQLVSRHAESCQLFILGTCYRCGILYIPMSVFNVGRKKWASLLCVGANRHYELDRRAQQLLNVLGLLPAYIDADLLHGLNGQRVNAPGANPSAHYSKPFARDMTQISLRHLAARRIAGTQEQDLRFHGQLSFTGMQQMPALFARLVSLRRPGTS